LEHLLKLWTLIRRSRDLIHIFVVDQPALLGRKLPQGEQLVSEILPPLSRVLTRA
jgi:hypothetical protein